MVYTPIPNGITKAKSESRYEPRWVLVQGILHEVSEFAHLKPHQRPAATCPLCHLPVVLKLGSQKAHHYAHEREAGCAASQPETALHLNTKFHLYHQLQQASEKQLWIEQSCKSCQKAKQRLLWVENWDAVEVEYRSESIRPDIALLCQGRVIAALEIFVTYAVDERKAAYLAAQAIPWLEIPATPALYEPPTAWTPADPLCPSQSSAQHLFTSWLCPKCEEKTKREQIKQEQQERLLRQQNERQEQREKYLRETVTHAAMMADIYFKNGKKYREVFFVKKQVRDGQCLKVWIENEKRESQKTISVTEERPLRVALQELKDFVTEKIENFGRQGTVVDVVAPWRLWEPGKKFVARDSDRYPLRYFWDENKRQWTPISQRTTTPKTFPQENQVSVSELLNLTNPRYDSRVRQQAVTMLGELSPEVGKPHLRAFLRDRDSEVRFAAALAGARWDDPAALPVLLDFVSNPEFPYRHTALSALCPFLREARVAALLQETLNDGDNRVRVAAQALLKSKESIGPGKQSMAQNTEQNTEKTTELITVVSTPVHSPLLTVELVPQTSWFSNVRDHVDKETWDKLRRQIYREAHHVCQICGGRGPEWPVECHEVWEYDDHNHLQKLVGLIALCPACHEIKHIGLTGIKGRREIAKAHLARINGWTAEQVEDYLQEVWLTWRLRSHHQWTLDLTFLEQFGIFIEPKR